MMEKAEMMKRVGDLVRRRREEMGLSQEGLAHLLSYEHKTSISKIEKGKAGIPREMLPKFSLVLGVDIPSLAGWDEVRKAESLEYCIEQMMRMIGWDLIQDEEGNMVLNQKGKTYQLEEGDFLRLEEELVMYMQFVLTRLAAKKARS